MSHKTLSQKRKRPNCSLQGDSVLQMLQHQTAPQQILWQITFRSSNICPTRHQQIASFQFRQFCDWFRGCYRQQGPQRCFETEAFNLHEKSKLTLDWLFQIKLLHCHSSARWWSIHMLLSVEPGNFYGKTVQFRQRRVWEMTTDSQLHISVIKRKFS